MKEVNIFFTALLFYTRIPCPPWVKYSDTNLTKATRYLPVVGWIVGGCTALILLGSLFLFQTDVSILLSMLGSILLTGAFHEDGFADVCDGFGGGWTKQKILDIMKDSRIGAYGVIGIALLLALKFMAIRQLSVDIRYSSLIGAHTLSRLSCVFIMRFSLYARPVENSKSKIAIGKIHNYDFLGSLFFGMLSLVLFNSWYGVFVLVPLFITQYCLGRYFKKWLGGYTGDCLGAVQQISEVVCYLSIYTIHEYVKNRGLIETLIA